MFFRILSIMFALASATALFVRWGGVKPPDVPDKAWAIHSASVMHTKSCWALGFVIVSIVFLLPLVRRMGVKAALLHPVSLATVLVLICCAALALSGIWGTR
jgi:hypothetical protein